jgi:hypothetical protein
MKALPQLLFPATRICCAAGLAWCVVAGCEKSPAGNPAAPNGKDSVAAVSQPGDVAQPAWPAERTTADPAPSSSANVSDDPGTPASAPNTHEAKPAQAAVAPKRREPLFENWPKPDLVLFITGQQHGYIEPCGCTGLIHQKGGLARRATCKKSLAERGWEVVALDAGNQVSRFGRQAEMKFQITAEGLKKLGYRAIGLGPDDLRLSAGELVAQTAQDGDQQSLFVCANAAVINRDLTPRFIVIKAAGKKIGVTSVLGTDRLTKIASDEIIKQPPEQALREIWPQLQQQACDLYVLLAQASLEESQKLAQSVPHFDLVVTAEEVGEPAYQPEEIPNTKSLLIQVGIKAMYVGVVGLFTRGEPRLRYQRVPLDDRFADAPEMLELLASYQEQLKTAGLEGLEVKPIPHPSGRQFVGSKACEECHDEAYDIWKKSKHALALQTLMRPGERSEIPRHFDPECLSCHVVGWNPQKFFPYVSGYLGVEETPLMHNVGCENCHGPGSAHVEAENSKSAEDVLEQLRKEVRLPEAEAEKKCIECHDLDNSVNFHVEGAFDEYWKKIKH